MCALFKTMSTRSMQLCGVQYLCLLNKDRCIVTVYCKLMVFSFATLLLVKETVLPFCKNIIFHCRSAVTGSRWYDERTDALTTVRTHIIESAIAPCMWGSTTQQTEEVSYNTSTVWVGYITRDWGASAGTCSRTCCKSCNV